MKKIEEVDLKFEEYKKLLPLTSEQQKILDKKIRLEFQYNSNHIEGNTLTYDETELLLIFDETTGNHTLREYEEMKASDIAFKMVEFHAKNDESKLSEKFIKELNQILLVRPYWKDAITADGLQTKRKIDIGDYKKFPNSVRLENGEIFEYASPIDTPILMKELVEWYSESETSIHPITLAAQLHYKFVRIHPFDDGNGRISRLLMNYVLLRNGIPAVVIKSADKVNYLRALRNADSGNLNAFVEYIASQSLLSLNWAIKAGRNESLEESEDWKKRLVVLKKHITADETITTRKSNEVLYDFINIEIRTFLHKLRERLKDVEDLFLTKTLNITFNGPKDFDFEFSLSEIQSRFYNDFELIISYQDFIFRPEKKLKLQYSIKFNFEDLRCVIILNGKHVGQKLYHQNLTEKDISEFTNILGPFFAEKIEDHMNQN